MEIKDLVPVDRHCRGFGGIYGFDRCFLPGIIVIQVRPYIADQKGNTQCHDKEHYCHSPSDRKLHVGIPGIHLFCFAVRQGTLPPGAVFDMGYDVLWKKMHDKKDDDGGKALFEYVDRNIDKYKE